MPILLGGPWPGCMKYLLGFLEHGGGDNSLPNKRVQGTIVGRRKPAKNNLPRKIERSKPDFWVVGEENLK